MTAVDRLAGLQAQWSPSPYLGLWTRLDGFERDDLTRALEERTIVKASLMRQTLHLVSAREYPFYATFAADARAAFLASALRRRGLDGLGDLQAEVMRFASDRPRTWNELLAFLEERAGGSSLARFPVWTMVHANGWFVHPPPSGTWGHFGGALYTAAATWLGELPRPSLAEAAEHVVRRYLGAFGPATLADAVSWSRARMPVIREAIAALGDEVRVFADERGRRLYDLRDAPRPRDGDPPVRYLPKWDNLLLSYQPAERGRVLPERYRRILIARNGDVSPTILVGGRVAGRWGATRRKDVAALTVEPFERIAPAARRALEQEGERLVRFIEPGVARHEVTVASAPAAAHALAVGSGSAGAAGSRAASGSSRKP